MVEQLERDHRAADEVGPWPEVGDPGRPAPPGGPRVVEQPLRRAAPAPPGARPPAQHELQGLAGLQRHLGGQ
ncbi:MAG TPA: hypothetical protein VKP11_04205, partial [Frankiaceae bacterium]|nr:hypothetical protein [Frankiaceae bacterium]